jgi:signal recognition particle subunit SRP72
MASTEQEVPNLFAKLKSTIENDDDQQSLELCDQLLKLKPDDKTVLQCKVVSLIRLEKYKDALTLIARQFRNADIDMSYEKIYCYYRTNQFVPAMELLEQVKSTNKDSSLLYLEAQIVIYKNGILS